MDISKSAQEGFNSQHPDLFHRSVSKGESYFTDATAFRKIESAKVLRRRQVFAPRVNCVMVDEV
jgi:hypothetical protein